MLTYKLFTTERCLRCPAVKDYLQEHAGLKGEIVDADQPEGLEQAREFEVQQVPTVIFFKDDQEVNRACSVEQVEMALKK